MTQNKSLCMKSDELEVYIKLLNDVNRALCTLGAYNSQYSHILSDDINSEDLIEFISLSTCFCQSTRNLIRSQRLKALNNELQNIF